jgi:hypothetical protein
VAIAVSYKKQQSTRVGFYSVVLGICWTCTVIVSLVWSFHLQKQEAREIALNVARAYIQSDNSYRRWNALQGGIYIPADNKQKHTLPADVPEQEIITSSGKRLILAAHVQVMEEVYEITGQNYMARGELKSLNPISMRGKADEWQTAALKALERGEKEFGEVTTMNGEKHFSLMQPFVIEKFCVSNVMQTMAIRLVMYVVE